MPLPFLAQLGISAAPSLINAGANLLRGDEESTYEKKLSSMADMFEEQASGPATETRVFKEGKRQLDKNDEKRREQVQSASATTGATDEARLASMQDSNEVYADAFNRLLGRAKQYQDRMRQRYLNVIGQQEQAGRYADQRFQQKVNSITQPLGQAGQAFLLSDIFSGATNTGVTPGNTPPASPSGGAHEYGLFGGSAQAGYAA